jgi:hypothetical protein
MSTRAASTKTNTSTGAGSQTIAPATFTSALLHDSVHRVTRASGPTGAGSQAAALVIFQTGRSRDKKSLASPFNFFPKKFCKLKVALWEKIGGK